MPKTAKTMDDVKQVVSSTVSEVVPDAPSTISNNPCALSVPIEVTVDATAGDSTLYALQS